MTAGEAEQSLLERISALARLDHELALTTKAMVFSDILRGKNNISSWLEWMCAEHSRQQRALEGDVSAYHKQWGTSAINTTVAHVLAQYKQSLDGTGPSLFR